MTASRLTEDEPESDDQGPMWNSPLTLLSKPVLKTDGIGSDSTATLLKSSLSSSLSISSRKSSNYFSDFSSIVFNDNNLVHIIEIDCDYTKEQIRQLWFTKVEYNGFLQACDDDAQKGEEHEKEIRVNKIKKQIRRQRRQRRKEEKQLLLQKKSNNQIEDESMNSMALENEADDIVIDDSFEDEDISDSKHEINEDEEGWLCSYGLEAWTLEGYKEREYNREKAVDAVLNEQYAAWDCGMVENAELMSALYFAASATSKHSAAKKARELEEDVQEYTVVSTLDDYNKAVQALNVLQKSLHVIQNKNEKIRINTDRWSKTKRRGSNGNAASCIGTATSIIDRALAITEKIDQAPQIPIKSTSSHRTSSSSLLSHPPPASSSSSQKKYKPRVKVSGTQHKIYKSKAATNIIIAPPTPPVTKRRTVVYKPSQGGQPKLMEPPVTKSPRSQKIVYKPSQGGQPKLAEPPLTKSPRSQKIVYKPIVGGKPKLADPPLTKSPRSQKIVYKPMVGGQPPKIEGARTDKSPGTKKKKNHKGDRSRSRSRTKSPRPVAISTKDSNESLAAGKLLKKISSPTDKSRKLVIRIPPNVTHSVSSDSATLLSSLSTHSSSSHQKNNKKEHRWSQEQKQACQ
jgi:hypothetical protein